LYFQFLGIFLWFSGWKLFNLYLFWYFSRFDESFFLFSCSFKISAFRTLIWYLNFFSSWRLVNFLSSIFCNSSRILTFFNCIVLIILSYEAEGLFLLLFLIGLHLRQDLCELFFWIFSFLLVLLRDSLFSCSFVFVLFIIFALFDEKHLFEGTWVVFSGDRFSLNYRIIN